jgi:putative oxidoreductase
MQTIAHAELRIQRWLARNSIRLLRISMGGIILIFGFLKYFPGLSPAEHMVETVSRMLSLGLAPDRLTMDMFATVECLIGLSLITNIGLRVAIYPMALWAIGILLPLALMPAELFSGPDHMPTLEGQYVLKDLILLAATMVIADATVHRAPRTHGASGSWT